MDNGAHNLVSATVGPVAIIAFFTQWNPVITGIVALAALAWYAVCFYDRFKRKRQSQPVE